MLNKLTNKLDKPIDKNNKDSPFDKLSTLRFT